MLDSDIPDEYVNQIKEFFCVPKNTEIRPYEAYVETWANIFLISIVSQELKKSSILEEEITYSIYQAAKILVHFGFKEWGDFYKNPTKDSRDYCQKSSILSYFIIKAAILFNIDEFISFCGKNNGEENIVNYNKNSGIIHQDFVNLIELCCDDVEFQTQMNNMMKNKDFDNSLRMTCNETIIL